MTGFRTYAALAGLAVAAALAASIAGNVRQGAALVRAQACIAAIKPDARAGADPRRLCDGVIADRWARAVQADTCDQALAARPENRFGVASNCSGPVKALVAQRDVAARERDAAQADLKQTRADQVAAINRATAAVTAQAERKARAAAAVQGAPRGPSGLVICDARCLRDRTVAGPDQGD
ncbi:MAG: hypothetical protein Q8K93_17600 [Reyranella sp.]|uniref:hypothetical protein n=1 Tax=Reyranella sp. TaxID=1929291 RepID=UPI0027311CC0|nr:hypothetical protein [Reyranella sp.]MDP1964006.1 hypothetical protein [Reyranella sp.]MDP2376547.1 hypothetical protein [Reyranella sp.]